MDGDDLERIAVTVNQRRLGEMKAVVEVRGEPFGAQPTWTLSNGAREDRGQQIRSDVVHQKVVAEITRIKHRGWSGLPHSPRSGKRWERVYSRDHLRALSHSRFAG